LTPEEKPADREPKANQHWILWTLVGAFIVAAIGVMFAVDYYYADDSQSATQAPGAADN
jgi:hypothetical protein